MRTTLTLHPDVGRLLREEVHRRRRPFKDVMNDAIRRSLAPGGVRRHAAARRWWEELLNGRRQVGLTR